MDDLYRSGNGVLNRRRDLPYSDRGQQDSKEQTCSIRDYESDPVRMRGCSGAVHDVASENDHRHPDDHRRGDDSNQIPAVDPELRYHGRYGAHRFLRDRETDRLQKIFCKTVIA